MEISGEKKNKGIKSLSDGYKLHQFDEKHWSSYLKICRNSQNQNNTKSSQTDI